METGTFKRLVGFTVCVAILAGVMLFLERYPRETIEKAVMVLSVLGVVLALAALWKK